MHPLAVLLLCGANGDAQPGGVAAATRGRQDVGGGTAYDGDRIAVALQRMHGRSLAGGAAIDQHALVDLLRQSVRVYAVVLYAACVC